MTAYKLIRSRRRTIALEVTSELEVLVRAPLRAPQSAIDAFVAQHEAWLSRALARQAQRRDAHPEPTPEQWAALRQAAEAYIPPRLAAYARQMGVSPTGLKFTRARTRFGSCSAKDSICFSLRLMQYPSEAIDYVIVHELAHIRHKNHSSAFYAFVASVLPDYRARRALLRE